MTPIFYFIRISHEGKGFVVKTILLSCPDNTQKSIISIWWMLFIVFVIFSIISIIPKDSEFVVINFKIISISILSLCSSICNIFNYSDIFTTWSIFFTHIQLHQVCINILCLFLLWFIYKSWFQFLSYRITSVIRPWPCIR